MTSLHSLVPIAVLLVAIGSASKAQEPAAVVALKKAMPKDVALFISRSAECNHWSGEALYDKARAQHIAAAVKRLRCDRLDVDERRLVDKHRHEPQVLTAIGAAKSL